MPESDDEDLESELDDDPEDDEEEPNYSGEVVSPSRKRRKEVVDTPQKRQRTHEKVRYSLMPGLFPY